ncbi:glycoside hydrolase family 20 zincin-like fold domain-containing protein [Candidatus Latescibacterota bacterium]
MLKTTSLVFCLLFSFNPVLTAEILPVTHAEQTEWLRHLIPLPHEITIKEKITLDPKNVSITMRRGAGEIEKSAADELKKLFEEKTGTVPSGKAYEIIIGTVDSGGKVNNITVDNASRLKELPNNDQAYIIQSGGNKRIILTALDQKGVYYAAMTLRHLIQPFISRESVTIPLMEVVDWPDLEERGLWLFSDPPNWIPWLASLKINWGEIATSEPHNIERGKKNRMIIEKDLLMKARLMAFKYHPFIMHFNFLHQWDLFKTYPELAGIGDSALAGRYFAHKMGTNQHRAPCASKPLFTQILTEWMMDIAAQGVDEVSCWLSERPAQCSCEDCIEGQFVLEARACVTAWREVRKTYPEFIIRLFISTTTSEKYYKVLAEAPPEVKIERACATWIERIPHIPRDLYSNPLFDSYAAQGRWIASYDVPIGSYGRVDTPEFKVPCSSAHRIKDYVGQLIRRKWRGAYGMMAFDNQNRGGKLGKEVYEFNINALAEWAWNLNGRTEKEFAIAWATREDYDDPKAVGEWSELMGPVEFDVYDSEFPICYSWGQASQMINERKRPYLGEGMFRYYMNPQDFDRKIETCDHALEIAKSFKNPYLANETKVVRSYIRLVKSIYEIAEWVATDDLDNLKSQDKLRSMVENLELAGKENVDALKKWRSALGPEPWHFRFHDAYKATEKTIEDISATVSSKYFY